MLVGPWPYLEVGQMVWIEDGALSGVAGVLTSFRGTRIVASILLLRRSAALEIDPPVVASIRARYSGVVQPGMMAPLPEPVVA